jgi:hypothetical protein
MSWSQTTLTWPPSAASIEQALAPTLSALPGAGQSALARLNQAAGSVGFNRHALSEQAAGRLALRAQLEQLLVDGLRLTVTPYDHDVGIATDNGHYLAPGNAARRLADKLQDSTDPHCPGGTLHAVGVLVTATALGEFAEALRVLTAVLPLPELAACARRAAAEQGHLTARMAIPGRALTPKWVPGRLHSSPLRPALAALGAQLTQLESLAADATSPIGKLEALAARRAVWLDEQQQALAELKAGMGGRVFSFSASGTPASLAGALTGGLPGYEQAHTAAVLLVSNQPLTFFKELLP